MCDLVWQKEIKRKKSQNHQQNPLLLPILGCISNLLKLYKVFLKIILIFITFWHVLHKRLENVSKEIYLVVTSAYFRLARHWTNETYFLKKFKQKKLSVDNAIPYHDYHEY